MRKADEHHRKKKKLRSGNNDEKQRSLPAFPRPEEAGFGRRASGPLTRLQGQPSLRERVQGSCEERKGGVWEAEGRGDFADDGL